LVIIFFSFNINNFSKYSLSSLFIFCFSFHKKYFKFLLVYFFLEKP
jgi:hypothetical protein